MYTYVGLKLIQAEPEKDGYKVVYPDGYVSWSPKEVFEEAYKDVRNLSFSEALYLLKKGYILARKGWNGKGIFIKMQFPDESSKMTHPYIYIDTTGLKTDNRFAPKDRVPWLASQTDILADDWSVV